MHILWPECAAHCWVDFEQQSSHHHTLDDPSKQRTHPPRWQQMHILWPECAAHCWVDFEQQSSHHHTLDDPSKQRTHPSRWQQMRFVCGLHLLHTPKLIVNCRAVTTILWMTPTNNRSIHQDGSKCNPCSLNFLHIPELILNCRAVTAILWITPTNNRSIHQDGSECTKCGLNLLRIPELIRTAEQSPPNFGLPQQTTDPSSKMAAKAAYVAFACCTFLSWSWTAEQSPP